MDKIIYLTNNEEKAIRSLAQNDNYSALRHVCEIPDYGVHLFVAGLRRKTGISNTKDPQECASYIEQYKTAISSLPPTMEQRDILHHFLAGDTYTGIAYQITLARKANPALKATDIPRLVDNACEAVGIFTRDDLARRVQIRIYIAAFEAKPNIPLSPTEEKILRQWVNGTHALEIADAMGERGDYIKWKIKETCRSLGLCAKGRGVQRTLVRAYFEQLDWKNAQETPVTMDDPAF